MSLRLRPSPPSRLGPAAAAAAGDRESKPYNIMKTFVQWLELRRRCCEQLGTSVGRRSRNGSLTWTSSIGSPYSSTSKTIEFGTRGSTSSSTSPTPKCASRRRRTTSIHSTLTSCVASTRSPTFGSPTGLKWHVDVGSNFFVTSSRSRHVGKTGFVEQRSFWNLFRSFDRLWIMLILFLQAAIIVKITWKLKDGLFDENGKLLGSSSSPIQIWKEGNCIEQSSTDIWLAVCAAVKAACSIANIAGEEVKGIGFAATCSLVAVDSDGSPVTVSWSGDSRRNIIVWMDHRAVEQAERINSRNSPVLQYCGGALSPEMQPPKLLWVKENLQESWSMVFRWMDLSDWLSYRATGDDTRSLCTTVCKWTYLGHAHMQQNSEKDSRDMEACGWDDDFWEEIGLGDLVEGHHAKIGRSVAFPGHALGSGLTPTAAKELGLVAGIPVGTSLIDAHAGGVGVMESVPVSDSEAKEDDVEALCHRMVLVCGTSTCHMAVSKSKLFIPGVWGPFWSAMVPEYWLTEGGQSATGALLDHVIENHVASALLANRAASRNISIFELLNKTLETMTLDLKLPFLASLTEETHVLPDFHGNRSPIADPKAKGIVCGLTLDTSEKQLALLYLATVEGIAYGTRHIVEHCNAHGHKIDTILACGGLAKNPLFVQEHADIIGCPIILPRESESVLLGAAILGSVAARKYSSVHEAMKALNAAGRVIHPSKDPKVKKYHDAKYRIFRELYEQQLSHRSLMAQALT